MMEQLIEVDGSLITREQFNEMANDPKIRLVETEPGKFKKLIRMEG